MWYWSLSTSSWNKVTIWNTLRILQYNITYNIKLRKFLTYGTHELGEPTVDETEGAEN